MGTRDGHENNGPGRDVITFRWVTGVLLVILSALTGLSMKVVTNEIAFMDRQLHELQARLEPLLQKIVINSERITLLEWQFRLLEKRLDLLLEYQRKSEGLPPPGGAQ